MRTMLVGAVIGALAISSTALAKGGERFDMSDAQPIGRSSVLNGANGIYVSPVDGNVYAASVIGTLYTTAFADGQILTMTPSSRPRALNQTGFIAPGGVTVDDGSLWVADFFSVREMRHRRDPVTTYDDRFDPPFTEPASANTVDASGAPTHRRSTPRGASRA